MFFFSRCFISVDLLDKNECFHTDVFLFFRLRHVRVDFHPMERHNDHDIINLNKTEAERTIRTRTVVNSSIELVFVIS